MFLFTGIALGIVVSALVRRLLNNYWTDICNWLNNTAADKVQKYIGYDARKAMQRAVNTVDRAMDKIRNKSQVYYRSDPLATYYDKVTMVTTAPTYEFDEEFINAVEEKGSWTQEMEYKI